MTEWKGRRLHFIAIGGAGMSGLALVAHELGAEVTGSDRAESSYMERLRAAGLDPRVGHDPANLPEDADVVVSTAIPEDNPELALARERGQRVMHRGDLLAELCAEKRLIAVAGTHGKTTTTAMIVWALRGIGGDPAFFIGGELPGAGRNGTPTNAAWGTGQCVIAEADESDGSFLQLQPDVAVITNVELDHHARWASLAELKQAFAAFCAPARAVVAEHQVKIDGLERAVRFGLDEGHTTPHFYLPVPGRHNALNALAAVGALEQAGFDAGAVEAALCDFPGVARRLERKGSRNGARIYDDYAHHPTEVRAALEAARELTQGGGRLIAAFQPHLYSRTKALATEFGAALTVADEIAVLDVYPAREQPVGDLAGVSGLLVARAAAQWGGGKQVWWLPDAEKAEAALADELRPGDVFVTLGAGDIWRLAEALVEDSA
jgi:UDP-N-acetylmuramate--alanine ligase